MNENETELIRGKEQAKRTAGQRLKTDSRKQRMSGLDEEKNPTSHAAVLLLFFSLRLLMISFQNSSAPAIPQDEELEIQR